MSSKCGVSRPSKACASSTELTIARWLSPTCRWPCVKVSMRLQPVAWACTITRCPRMIDGRLPRSAAFVCGIAKAATSLKSYSPRIGGRSDPSSRARKAISSASRSSRSCVAITPSAFALSTRWERSKARRKVIMRLFLEVHGLADLDPLVHQGRGSRLLFFRRVADRLIAAVGETFLHVRLLQRCDNGIAYQAPAFDRCFRRRMQAPDAGDVGTPQAAFLQGRHVGHRGVAMVASDGDGAHLAILDIRRGRADAAVLHRHVPAQQRDQRRARALERDVLDVHAGLEVHHDAHQMRRGADAAPGEGEV